MNKFSFETVKLFRRFAHDKDFNRKVFNAEFLNGFVNERMPLVVEMSFNLLLKSFRCLADVSRAVEGLSKDAVKAVAIATEMKLP